uniref:Bm600 n=1 Tax=Brugia malayi TaxID=6279 RepID=A0A0H5S9F3_BRUMA|nr:Bm600 [Brugia malayi]
MLRGCLRLQPKEGGKLHLRLNMTTRAIANNYREGKLQRTLKREFKDVKPLKWKPIELTELYRYPTNQFSNLIL